MRKLYRLTLGSFFGPLIVTFLVVIFVLLMQFLWKYIDDLVGKGLEWYVIMELLFYASASFVPLALPLALLLSAIMSFGKLSETYELTALKSAGISLFRVQLPAFFTVSLIACFAFYFSNSIIPVANLKFGTLLYSIRHHRPALDIQPGIFYNGIEGYTIRVTSKSEDNTMLYGVIIYDHTAKVIGNSIVITAERARMVTSEDEKNLSFELYNGSRTEEMDPTALRGKGFPANRVDFKTYFLNFDLSGFDLQRANEELFKSNHQMLNISQLNVYIDSLQEQREINLKQRTKYFQSYHNILLDSNPSKTVVPTPPIQPRSPNMPAILQEYSTVRAKEIVERAKSLMRVQIDNLNFTTNDHKERQKHLARYQIEWHRKFTLSLACLTLFLIGAPLGAVIRKGGIGLPTIYAIVVFCIFYIISIAGEKLAKENSIPAVVGMWMSTVCLLPIAIILMYRANRDRIQYRSGGIRLAFIGNFFRWVKRKIVRKQAVHPTTTPES